MENDGSHTMHDWEQKFQDEIRLKQQKEDDFLAERKAAAERDLDIFYDNLTDKKAQKQAQNREHEEYLQSQLEDSATKQNPFERVMQLIDTQAVPPETQIMHSLLVRLKQQPNITRRNAAQVPIQANDQDGVGQLERDDMN